MSDSILIGRDPAAGTELGLALRMANRHGLITGATGTGKTVSLQVLAEGFARNGVPVFLADVKGDMSGMLAPLQRETFLGNAEVLQVFDISKVGKIAGCRVTEGRVQRGARVRIVREGIVVLELGTLATLKRFKDEVPEVVAGQECGMHFQGFQVIRERDLIECFTVEEVKRTLA